MLVEADSSILINATVVQSGRERDAVTFMELYQRLCSQRVLKNRSSLLYFMLTLASDQALSYNLPTQVGNTVQ